jgi:hypothetical protein
MAEGFIRSPEAVRDRSAYQEAPPHWANACEESASNSPDASARLEAAKNLFDMVGNAPFSDQQSG